MINFLNIISNNTSYVGWGNTNLTAGYQVGSQNVYLSSGTELQIGLAWLASATLSGNNVYLTNYDLYLYDSYGALVASSTLTNSSVELIRYTATTAGTYTMVVYQSGSKTSTIGAETIYLTYQRIYS